MSCSISELSNQNDKYKKENDQLKKQLAAAQKK